MALKVNDAESASWVFALLFVITAKLGTTLASVYATAIGLRQ